MAPASSPDPVMLKRMPMMPDRACPKCRKRGCSDPSHKPRDFAHMGPRRVPRDRSWKERKRRSDFIADHRNRYGNWCPVCGDQDVHADGKRVHLWADHITPVALGGDEHGPLRAMCSRCQSKQGRAVMMARKK